MSPPETCPGCGEPVKSDWTVCEKCLLPRNLVSGREEARVTIRCQCGGRIGSLDSVCPSCHKPKPRVEITPSDDPNKPKSAGALAVMGTLVLGLGTVGAGAFIFTRQQAAMKKAEEAKTAVSTSTAAGAVPAAGNTPESGTPLPVLEWTVKGRVYDLLTLRPVADATITLTDKLSGKSLSAKTGTDGSYAIKAPPLSEGGYAVAVRVQGRAGRFLEEMEPPYSGQGRDRRQEALELLDNPSLVHVPIMLLSGQSETVYDLVVVSR